MGKAAATRLDFCVTKETKAKEKREANPDGKRKGPGPGRPSAEEKQRRLLREQDLVLEWIMNNFSTIPSVPIGDAGPNLEAIDYKKPCIMRVMMDESTEIKKDIVVKVASQLANFKSSPEYASTGRQHKKLPDDMCKNASAILSAFFKPGYLAQPTADNSLTKDLMC
eukprot:9168377-Pyramimonas_sp.AAC.1